ncbi:MAG TPA: ATPase, T2SS/T4P/T4SS family [Blastocatellia bacterium]|jgi:type IV pilus assembly protein PilB|nr:ATPase, T2SS/T4P/T4SS family [Blastocatellia bacterium]
MLQQSLEDQIGNTLVKDGILTQDQLSKARKIKEHLGGQKTLDEVLIEMNWVSVPRLEAIVRRQKTKMLTGEILVARGLVTADDVAAALDSQRKSGPRARRIGEILMDMGLIEERHVVEALSDKFSIPVLDPDISQIDCELGRRISLKYLRRQVALPIKLEGGELHLLVSDPTNTSFMEEIARLFNCRVRLSLASSAVILQTLNLVDSLLQSKDAGIADYQKVKYHSLEVQNQAQGQAGDGQIIQMVDQLIRAAIEEGASDVHLEPLASKLRVRYRIDGVLIHKMDFPREYTPRIVSRIKILSDADVAERRKHQDGRIFVKTDKQEIDIRVSFYATVFGENVVLRILNKASLISLQELGFAPNILRMYTEDVLASPSGITLVTGPTGSGKTTTLYSSIDYCNDPTVKIITCEDPVEYVIDGISQCSINEKIGLTFNDTLRSIVRQDPDIIVIGEIRDKFSADVAVQSALTGHKVFATFHTEDSVGALVRLINMDIETSLIASTIAAVLAQRLVRKVCVNCPVQYVPDERVLRRFGLTSAQASDFTLYKGKGCSSCNFTGYRGRLGIYELLVPNVDVRDAILQKRTMQEIRQISLDECSLCTMQEDGMVKALRGRTTLEEVLENAPRTFHHRPLETLLKIVG